MPEVNEEVESTAMSELPTHPSRIRNVVGITGYQRLQDEEAEGPVDSRFVAHHFSAQPLFQVLT